MKGTGLSTASSEESFDMFGASEVWNRPSSAVFFKEIGFGYLLITRILI